MADGETLHLFSNIERFNGDPQNGVYLRWKRGDEEPIREQVPFNNSFDGPVKLLANGQPVVLQTGMETGGSYRLLTRSDGGWEEYRRWPAEMQNTDSHRIIGGWEIGPDGATYILIWEEVEQGHGRIVLWRGQGDDWTGQIVAANFPSKPIWFWIGFDPQRHPVVAAGRQTEPFGWLKAFRQQTSRPPIP